MQHVQACVSKAVTHSVVNHVAQLVGIVVETLVPVHVETYVLGALLFVILRVKQNVRMRRDTLV